MVIRKSIPFSFFLLIYFLGSSVASVAQGVKISNDTRDKRIVLGNDKISLTLGYNKQAIVSSVLINGRQVIDPDGGIYSAIRTNGAFYSSRQALSQPVVGIFRDSVRISGITYGDENLTIKETWTFMVRAGDITFNIDRTLSKAIVAEQVALPVFVFNNINTWEGAYQDYGGLAWFYLFNKRLDTYGVHSSTSQFWNSKTGQGLTIAVDAPGRHVVMDYSRTAKDQLAYTIAVAAKEMVYRFDSGTHRRRYIRDRADVWAPVALSAGKTSHRITLSCFDFNEQFGRGNLVGLNAAQVSGVLNTIARIGVIDKNHFGGNSWHTPYGPICLHEQYIAQMGLAINDKHYLKGYQQCLDYYRDNAVKPDGRVWPRWAYSNEDAMPGVFTSKGFYEAQWGYLLDSNPDLVTNVVELYHQTGDKAWVKKHQISCEKALDWIIRRDTNGNGLVEMITDSHTQKRGSDWIDIIWAAYENAFVNAKLYYALVLWADIEYQLGNPTRGKYYSNFAAKMKSSFNKPTAEGGFWDVEKQCYIHWRDKDGSIHGNNMVTPVNFMAIAYGICEDEARTRTILDNIEAQMQQERLFFWPICMYSYAPGEGNDWQFPFPNYENGDIFLSWGSVGVKAYAGYKPEIALKYVKNVLAQYGADGLAFQRYGRVKQDGLGDDILAGNSLAVVGLYQSIYGINPLYNRLYLDPHLTEDIAGTQVKYNYRDQQLVIDLKRNHYAVSDGQFTIAAKGDFGFFSSGNALMYFHKKQSSASLQVKAAAKGNLTLDIRDWGADQIAWVHSSKDKQPEKWTYQVNDLKPAVLYSVLINGNIYKQVKSSANGAVVFTCAITGSSDEVRVVRQ